MRPIAFPSRTARPSHDAGARRGPFAEWYGPQLSSEWSAARERVLMQRRSADLAANDWIAVSAVNAIVQNAVGTGLKPSSCIPADRIGVSSEEAAALGENMEWIWDRWSRHADVTGQRTFEELQRAALRSILIMGEALHLPVMTDQDGISLAIQPIAPGRLRTPAIYAADPAVRDGIRFDEAGRPQTYYIACPAMDPQAMLLDSDTSCRFLALPARVLHRTGVFHLFRREMDEQIRGLPVFAPSASLFRLLDDSLHYELLAQAMASKFPIFVTREDRSPDAMAAEGVYQQGQAQDEQPVYYTDTDGPQFMYGNAGEKPEVLKNERPSPNFLAFTKTILNGVASSCGIPYIALTNDFSETNYSSARAAMNEAWRTYRWWRQYLAEAYCQPVWEMVMEEAWLTGELELPAGMDFYRSRFLLCSCSWTGPARGYVDPVKEVQANILGINNHLMTRREAMAAAGRDYDDELPIMKREAKDFTDGQQK